MSALVGRSPQANPHSISPARGSPLSSSAFLGRNVGGIASAEIPAGAPNWSTSFSTNLRPNMASTVRSRDLVLAQAVAVGPSQAQVPFPSSSIDETNNLGLRKDFRYHFALNEYKILGQGSFGIVHEGVDLLAGGPVAIKIMPKARPNVLKEGNMYKLQREINVLKRLQGSKNVVQLYGCFEDSDNVQIVMELCAGMNLQNVVEAHGPLSERALALVAYQITRIILDCHELGIVHADVKPANFCLQHPIYNPLFSPQVPSYSKSPWLKALDFGCSQTLPDGETRLFTRTGTPAFIAPEVFARNYGVAADMWSLGVTLYWLYAECFPFFPEENSRAAKLDEVIDAVANAPIKYDYGRWLYMSPAGLDFIKRCLIRDKTLRMTAEEALQHPWFTGAPMAMAPVAS